MKLFPVEWQMWGLKEEIKIKMKSKYISIWKNAFMLKEKIKNIFKKWVGGAYTKRQHLRIKIEKKDRSYKYLKEKGEKISSWEINTQEVKTFKGKCKKSN
jgi:predicted ATP-dependent endonuclease of OLD family